MTVYPPTAPTYLSPKQIVSVQGQPLASVLSARVTYGWDQQLATADVVIPDPLPDQVGHRSMIRIYMGPETADLRFTGYITTLHHDMFPGKIVLGCEDILCLAKYHKRISEFSFIGMTDEEIVRYILTAVGIPFDPANILGTGKVLGVDEENTGLVWKAGESALSKIAAVDQVSVVAIDAGDRRGIYQTWCDRGGVIRRTLLDPLPSLVAVRSFVEGADFLAGSTRIEAVEPASTSSASGAFGLTKTAGPNGNPFAIVSNPTYMKVPAVEIIGPSDTQINLTDVSEFLLQQTGWNLVRADFTTHRGDIIGPMETVYFTAPQVRTAFNAHVQSVTVEQGEQGGSFQHISLISYRELNIADNPVREFDPLTGDEVEVGDWMDDQPDAGPEDLIASFTASVKDVESVVIDGVQTELTTVACEDTSTSATGEIVSRTWTAVGGTPATGSDVTFNPSFLGDLTGKTISIEVADTNANTATSDPQPAGGTATTPPMRREIFTAEGAGGAGHFSGTTWRTDLNSGGPVGVVANGAAWAAGAVIQRERLSETVTDLPETTVPGPVVSIWIEEDVSTGELAAGLTAGRVLRSSDKGETWTVCTPLPDTEEDVLQVVISRFTPGQIWALQYSHIWISSDDGGSWTLIRDAAEGQEFLSLRLTNFRNLVTSRGGPSALERCEEPTPFTFTGTPPTGLTGAMANVFADEIAAIDHSTPPKLWVTEEVGSWNMVPAEVPDLSAFTGAAPHYRNMQQDSAIARMGYVAVGDYALKTTDWWKPDTIFVLRQINVAGCGAGPIKQIGIGSLSSPPDDGGGGGGGPIPDPGGCAEWYAYSGNAGEDYPPECEAYLTEQHGPGPRPGTPGGPWYYTGFHAGAQEVWGDTRGGFVFVDPGVNPNWTDVS